MAVPYGDGRALVDVRAPAQGADNVTAEMDGAPCPRVVATWGPRGDVLLGPGPGDRLLLPCPVVVGRRGADLVIDVPQGIVAAAINPPDGTPEDDPCDTPEKAPPAPAKKADGPYYPDGTRVRGLPKEDLLPRHAAELRASSPAVIARWQELTQVGEWASAGFPLSGKLCPKRIDVVNDAVLLEECRGMSDPTDEPAPAQTATFPEHAPVPVRPAAPSGPPDPNARPGEVRFDVAPAGWYLTRKGNIVFVGDDSSGQGFYYHTRGEIMGARLGGTYGTPIEVERVAAESKDAAESEAWAKTVVLTRPEDAKIIRAEAARLAAASRTPEPARAKAAPEPPPRPEPVPEPPPLPVEPPAEPPVTLAEAAAEPPPTAAIPKILYVGCRPRLSAVVEFDLWIEPIVRAVEEDAQVPHYLLIPYAEGPKRIAALLAHRLRTGEISAPFDLCIDRRSPCADLAIPALLPWFEEVVEAVQ